MAGFHTTVWDLVRAAGDGGRTASHDLVARYRPSIMAFAKRRGLDADRAEDVAQEVLIRLFEDGLLKSADPARGRFRSLVAAVTRNVIGRHFEKEGAQKRGGGKAPLSLDETGFREALPASSEVPDDGFDHEWIAALLAAALAALERENPEYHAVLRSFLVEGKSRREVAAAIGKTEDAVRNLVARGKSKLTQLLRAEVEAYAVSTVELEEEMQWVSRQLERERKPRAP